MLLCSCDADGDGVKVDDRFHIVYLISLVVFFSNLIDMLICLLLIY